MNKGCVEVTNRRPCPICGKTDWCCFYSPTLGKEFVICKRVLDTSDTVGKDGKFYKFCGLTHEEQNAKFQEMDAWQANKDAWQANKDAWMRENKIGPYSEKNEYHRWYGASKSSRADSKTHSYSEYKEQEYEIVDPVSVKSHSELDRFYRALLRVLVLDPLHRQYLQSEGWSDELIRSSLVKSFPAKDVVRFNHKLYDSKNFYRKRIAQSVMSILHVTDLRGSPGAFVDHGGHWTLNGPSGIAIPVYDADGYLYGIRIRMDFCDIDRTMEQVDGSYQYTYDGITYYHTPFKGFSHYENGEKVTDAFYYNDKGHMIGVKGKYRPLTSYLEDQKEREQGRIVNRFSSGCQAENGISVYYNPKEDVPKVAYFTEGEKKGIFANAIMHSPVITFPGVSSWRNMINGEHGNRMIDKLKALGVRICLVAYDADKESNANVLRQQDAVAQALMAEGFSVGLTHWSTKYGKGLDDLLAGGNVPGFELLGSRN